MSVKTLIDKAAQRVGTRYKVAKALGVTPAQVYDWEEERKSCSPEDRARIAALANEDALQELVRGVLEKHEGTLRGKQLEQLLGKLLRQTGGVLHTVVALVASLTFLMIPAHDARAMATSNDV